uniref:Uncharacterized protein n=1 Tax=Octactis speculum TaxID=3111310 RepID=A0A7S2HNH3_9STRA
MKIKSSGRMGFAPHQPECASVAALLPAQRDHQKTTSKKNESPEQPPSKRQRVRAFPSTNGTDAAMLDAVKAGLKEYQSRRKLPKSTRLYDFDLDELRGFSVTTAQALGLSKSASARLAAKVKGLLLQHSDGEQE